MQQDMWSLWKRGKRKERRKLIYRPAFKKSNGEKWDKKRRGFITPGLNGVNAFIKRTLHMQANYLQIGKTLFSQLFQMNYYHQINLINFSNCDYWTFSKLKRLYFAQFYSTFINFNDFHKIILYLIIFYSILLNFI